MRKLTATLCLTLTILLGSLGMSGNVFAQTVDFAVKVNPYSYLADKTVCITNPKDLDEETLRDLGLVD